jgi:signal transduction histidine kinase
MSGKQPLRLPGWAKPLRAGFDRLVDFMVPPRAFAPGASQHALFRYRAMVRLTLSVCVAILLIPPYLLLRSGFNAWELAGFISMIGGPIAGALILRATGHIPLTIALMALNGGLGNTVLTIGTGGLESSFAPFSLLGLALCMLSSSAAVIVWVAAMAMLNYAVLMGLHIAGMMPPWDIPAREQQALHFLCLGFAISLVLGSAIASLNARLKARAALQRAKTDAETALAQLKEAQDQLVQSEKMAALGQLVAGVAHEINTPVGLVVTGISQLTEETATTRRKLEENALKRSDLDRYLELAQDLGQMIFSNSNRAANLVQSFKLVAVDQANDERRAFRIAEYLEDNIMSLGPKLRQAGHEVSVDCPPDLTMDGFPGAFSQIITNLLVNSAVHGFAPEAAGHIAIQVRLKEDDQIELVYRDDGKGIAKEAQGRIFDPFFTTNRGGGSTGLGMHIVYNLVTVQLKGAIALSSEPGQGVRFTLTFPRVTPA